MAENKKTTAKKQTSKVNKDKWKSTGGAGVRVDLSKVEFVNKPK